MFNSSVALPLINETLYLHDLLDAGYDSDAEYSEELNHKPIIDINPKNSKVLKEKIALAKEEKEKFIFKFTQASDKHHYKQRSMVERVNKYLKDDFGCDKIYYQGANKVACVLADLYTSKFKTYYMTINRNLYKNTEFYNLTIRNGEKM